MICFTNTSLAWLGENHDERESPKYERPDYDKLILHFGKYVRTSASSLVAYEQYIRTERQYLVLKYCATLVYTQQSATQIYTIEDRWQKNEHEYTAFVQSTTIWVNKSKCFVESVECPKSHLLLSNYLCIARFLATVAKYRFIRNECQGDQMLLAWPPRSPDATPCDFFLWGYVKDQVYVPHLPLSTPKLKGRIRTAIETITADMLQTVWNAIDFRVEFCRITQGAHTEHL